MSSKMDEASFMSEYSSYFVRSVCRIAKSRPVYLLRPLPEMPADVPREMARAVQLGRSVDITMSVNTYRIRNAAVWAIQNQASKACGAHILDPLPALCQNDACHGAYGNVPSYYDDNHLSEAGNRRLVPIFKRALLQ